MNKTSKNEFFSPLKIFTLYMLVSGLVIMALRFVFPGEAVPLPCFSRSWRLIQGFLEYLALYPALSLSALIIPFGFKIQAQKKNKPFSVKFFSTFTTSIVTAIVASTLFGLLFTLALPLARNYEANLLSRSKLFLHASERAREYAAIGEWDEAAHFVTVCEKIWPNEPEIVKLKTDLDIRIESASMRRETLPDQTPEAGVWSGGEVPLNATEALAMAETALAEERYYDAHWFATLGSRLAPPNSPEVATATRLAGRAWNGINSLEPTMRETQTFNTFRLKRDGYEALLGEEWIRAYYIFLELLTLTPKDPDAARYFALSEEGLKTAAFFIDEVELDLGQIFTNAIFSLPLGQDRLVMKVSSLSTSPDCAYGIETELMAFDRDGRPFWDITVPYIKILPLTLDSGSALAVLLRALDREDKTRYWEPVITNLGGNAPGNTEIALPVSWSDFLLLANIQNGLAGLSLTDLKTAAENLGDYGYLPQMFKAELLERFVRPLFLLPLGIFAIGMGWRYRAVKRPRYMGVPMLFILPTVFNGAVHFSRSWFNNLGIWAVFFLGFNNAAICFGVGIVILLVFSLIVLASSRD